MKHVAEWVAQAMGRPVWRDDALLKLYLYCLSRASHNRCVWRGIQLEVGDMPMSERHAAEELCWSRNKLDRQLKRLQEAGLVQVRRMPQRGLLLHIASLFQEDSATNETGSVMEPKVFHHGASSEATTGSTAEQAVFQNGASYGAQAFTMEPVLRQNDTSFAPAGSAMEPNPIEKKSSTPLSRIPSSEPKGFTEIWVSYPVSRRTNRAEAAALVAKAYTDGATTESILKALEADNSSAAWCREDGRYIPGIVKWLQKEAWRSYLEQMKPEEDEELWTSR